MTSRPPLSPKLEAILARLCRKLGPLAKTKAVKLPYLVDVVARHHLGRPVSEGTHRTWDYGVVTQEVYRFITHADDPSPFVTEPHPYSEGAVQIRFEGEEPLALTAEEIAVVDTVADLYGMMDVFRLGSLTKSLNGHLPPEAWGSNCEAETGEDAYLRLSDDWQEFVDRLPSLDLFDSSNWGESIEDPEEYVRRALYA